MDAYSALENVIELLSKKKGDILYVLSPSDCKDIVLTIRLDSNDISENALEIRYNNDEKYLMNYKSFSRLETTLDSHGNVICQMKTKPIIKDTIEEIVELISKENLVIL